MCLPEWSSYNTALISVTFLHRNVHQRMKRRLLGLVLGILHNLCRPTQYSFSLPQASHVPWAPGKRVLQPRRPLTTDSRSHPYSVACVIPLPRCPPPLHPHCYPHLQRANPHGHLQVTIIVTKLPVGGTLSCSSLLLYHSTF